MKGLGDIYAARQDAADEEAERDERIHEDAYAYAYEAARAGLLAGDRKICDQLGDLILETEADQAHLVAAMRHALSGDQFRVGALMDILARAVLYRHASAMVDLAVMHAQAPALVAEAEAPEGHIEMGWAA